MRYSLFAPRSCKGRSTSQARWRRTWTQLARRPGRRARRSVGQHTVSSMPPSRRRLGSEACLAHSYKGVSPLVESPRRGHAPSKLPGGVLPRLVAPRACLAWRLRDFATNLHEQCGLKRRGVDLLFVDHGEVGAVQGVDKGLGLATKH